MRLGRRGVGEASLTQFSIPPGSLPFWRERLERAGAPLAGPTAVFGEERLVFEDPDGMKAALVVATDRDQRTPWTTSEIGEDSAIRGFHGVTLSLADHTATAELLTALLGYEAAGKEGNTYRYAMPPARSARLVDIVELPGGQPALQAGGSVHHVAFSVADRAAQAEVRDRLVHAGYQVTPQIDRNYFFSIYFRSPGGVLLEVATEEPGFTVDEPVTELGRNLKLPQQHEPRRAEIERVLPPLAV
jgi:glyoxalase family protein